MSEKITTWLLENNYTLFDHKGDSYGLYRGAGGGILVQGHRPSWLGRGPYILRVTSDAVYQMHIRDNGVSGLLYQSWVCIGSQSYETQEQLKTIMERLTQEKATCWE